MKEQEKYYRGIDELNQTEEFVQNAHQEFPEYLPVSENEDKSTSRRDFLKLMGFSVAAVSLAACETPVKKIIPYVNKPEGIEPGNAQYYASTYVDGSDFASVLVRCREGRPILIEGNDSSSVSKGTVSSRGVASILNLYDSSRAQSFSKNGTKIDVKSADKEIADQLKAISASKGQIRIVSQTIMSPTSKSVIKDFIAKYPTAEHVVYDPSSSSALLEANGGYIPNYDFSKAKTIVSFNADFLGSYLNSSTFGKDFAETRKVRRGKNAKSEMSKLFQFETAMSLTGCNADVRVPIKPSEEGKFVIELYKQIVDNKEASNASVKAAAESLLSSKGESIVLSGTNDVNIQILVAEINKSLKNTGGKTINAKNRGLYKQGNDDQFISFVDDLKDGKVQAVIFLNSNPVYDTALGGLIKDSLAKTKLSISTADRLDETASECTYNCPSTHFLESWGDAEPIEGYISLMQPTIGKLFNATRCSEESLLSWAGINGDYHTYLRNYWKSNFSTGNFEVFWNTSLENGVYEPKHTYSTTEVVVNEEGEEEIVKKEVVTTSPQKAIKLIGETYKNASGIELLITESVNQGVGSQANNPWVYENPDPVSKVCWDNYVALNPVTAQELKVQQGKLDDGTASTVVTVIIPQVGKVDLPVVEQPGQAKNTAVVSIGFGRTKAGKLAEGASEIHPNPSGDLAIGVDVYPFLSILNSKITYSASNVTIKPTNKTHRIAQTQTHHTVMGRKIVQESTLEVYKNPTKFENEIKSNYEFIISTSEGDMKPNEVDIWKAPKYNEDGSVDKQEIVTHEYKNHHWGLVIDMNACYGCGACITSCHAENNVPVVGKDEILRKRDMHWLRIDRYYKADGESPDMEDRLSFENLKKLENPATDNPEVVFQPIMCQHCNHAPCETVCPVVATTHSSEGLNQMTYNRCIGTRYCANNCPYKVRRFNWFNYANSRSTDLNGKKRQFQHVNVTTNDDLGKMVLNPDVTVRARGVMEKCSMCAQRIQAGKLKAKIEDRKIKDGDIKMACQTSCSSGAIIFGDMNDANSEISQVLSTENADRSFHLLEELNVKPNVSYLTKIRNK